VGVPNKPDAGRPLTTGFLVLDKPSGISSMQAISIVRGKAGGAKTGHAGTLDPLATGVLVVALGRATKLIDRFMETDKRYVTQIDLSAFSTTDDLEGELEPVEAPRPPSLDDVRLALGAFTGAFAQRPPAYSAVKVRGRRAYKLARAGHEVTLPARPVVMHSVIVTGYEYPLLELQLHCGKGLYVRSLARDLGTALGTGGFCRSIRRTAVGPFTESMAVPLDRVPEPLTEDHLIPVDDAVQRLQKPGESSASS
jgi:tRNA pseudouridine55 synthase